MDKGCTPDMDVLLTAVELCSVEELEHLVSSYEILHVTTAACNEAISVGRLDVLLWLRSRDWPWDLGCCLAACRRQPEMLRWMLEHGCPSDGICLFMAQQGLWENLDVALDAGVTAGEEVLALTLDEYGSLVAGPAPAVLLEWAVKKVAVRLLDSDCPTPVRYLSPVNTFHWSADVVDPLDRRVALYTARRHLAAYRIQAVWRRCWYTPSEPICRKRLIRECEGTEDEPGLKRPRPGC